MNPKKFRKRRCAAERKWSIYYRGRRGRIRIYLCRIFGFSNKMLPCFNRKISAFRPYKKTAEAIGGCSGSSAVYVQADITNKEEAEYVVKKPKLLMEK